MTPSPDDLRTYELSLLNDLLEGCQIISFDWRYLYLNDAALEHARHPPGPAGQNDDGSLPGH